MKAEIKQNGLLEIKAESETSRDAKQFMYGYTECINDLLEWVAQGGDGLKKHSLK
jgi:hypothetical protein